MPNQPKNVVWLICLVNFPLFCPKCKAVTRVHYVRENMILREDAIAFS